MIAILPGSVNMDTNLTAGPRQNEKRERRGATDHLGGPQDHRAHSDCRQSIAASKLSKHGSDVPVGHGHKINGRRWDPAETEAEKHKGHQRLNVSYKRLRVRRLQVVLAWKRDSSSSGQPLSAAHLSSLSWPRCAARSTVTAFQGTSSSRSSFRAASCPASAAAAQTSSSALHPASTAQLSTSRCPLAAALMSVFSSQGHP
mmetsp:Transcript_37712/g.106561  ORF Transcript_37712/g.106561 Transcript_37712/m.106561 type:complete len:201 (-) Transcript_37712:1198-1800(-)